MPIKGLTNRSAAPLATSGQVRLGKIHKGEREGFGDSIKLKDLDYIVFTPFIDHPRIMDAWAAAYGDKPREINDARLPYSLSGNFVIENHAWLVAARHTAKGSVFMARSDGTNIVQARNPLTGRVEFPKDGGMSHEQFTAIEPKTKKPGYNYGGKVYPWQKTLSFDLILPTFNAIVSEWGIAGAGVVTFSTTSTYDITRLIDEYWAIVEDLVSLFANPLDSRDVDRVKNTIPLRNIPLRIHRTNDPISTPVYHKKGQPAPDPGDRLNSKRWLMHWQLNPDFSSAMSQALAKRQELMLAQLSNNLGGFLPSGNVAPARLLQQTNADLFGDPQPEAEIVEEGETGAGDYQAGVDEIQADFEEALEAVDAAAAVPDLQTPQRTPPPPVDWEKRAIEAKTVDAFCMAIWQLPGMQMCFEDAGRVKKGYAYIVGEFDRPNNDLAVQAFKVYANAMADGAKAKAAADAAQFRYTTLLEERLEAEEEALEAPQDEELPGEPIGEEWR